WPNCRFRDLQSRQHPSGEPIIEGSTCFVRRQETMIMSRIFSSAEPDPQLTWTAMNENLSAKCFSLITRARSLTDFAKSEIAFSPNSPMEVLSHGFSQCGQII